MAKEFTPHHAGTGRAAPDSLRARIDSTAQELDDAISGFIQALDESRAVAEEAVAEYGRLERHPGLSDGTVKLMAEARRQRQGDVERLASMRDEQKAVLERLRRARQV